MNIFRSVEASPEGDDQHFEALLLKKVRWHAGLKTGAKFTLDSGLWDERSMTVAVLRDKIKGLPVWQAAIGIS